MAEEKKLVVNNEDGDSAEINLGTKEEPEVEIDTTAAELEDLKAQLAAKDDRLIRLQAQAFLKDLLPLLDNLSRATQAAHNADNNDVETLRKGIEMIRQETAAVMGKHGLEPIETLGKPFDPNYHQAVGAVKSENQADGTIFAELQRGYIARGRVIRPSMVQVVNNN